MSEPTVTVFGWREFVALPDWGVPRLRAKLDTGARTSALHVEDYQELAATDDGRPIVRFHVLTGRRDAPKRVEVVTDVVGHAIVRDTRARPEQRPIVRTRVTCGPLEVIADISLTDRTGMNFRLLLGRRALTGQALVDPAGSFLRSDPPRRRAVSGSRDRPASADPGARS